MGTIVVEKQVQKVRKFQRLDDRYKELCTLSREDNNDDFLREMCCIEHAFECEGLKTYEQIALFCKEHGIKRAVDIGCAYGHQSEAFLIHEVDYVGVNEGKTSFWNNDKFQFITGHYPCDLPLKENDLGVSVLCLTWNCYLYEKEKTLREQCEALQKDFAHCLLYVTKEAKDFLSGYFKMVEKLDRNLYYFSNKENE